MHYLHKVELDIDNNHAERMVKPFVIGRNYVLKNIRERTGFSTTLYREQKHPQNYTASFKRAF